MRTQCVKVAWLGVFVLIVVSFISIPVWAQQEIKVAIDKWPPFADEKDPNFGICYALTKAILEPQGYQVTMKTFPASRIYKFLVDGEVNEIDATPIIWKNQERAQHLLFSESFLFNTVHFFVRSDSTLTYKTLEQLKGYRIGVIKGYYNGDEFDKADYLNKITCSDSPAMLHMLDKKRIEMGVLDKIVAETIIIQENLQGRFKILPKPLFQAGLHFAVWKKHPDGQKLIEAFNKGLEDIKKSGEYAKILTSYGITP